VSHDHAIAVQVDENCGECRGHASNALAADAIDLFARKGGQYTVAVRILAGGTSNRPGQRRASTEPCDRDCGIGSTAAINDEKVLRLGFSVRLRKAIDPEYLVKRDDAGAQDDGCVDRGAPGTHRSFTLFANCETRASPNV